jgi:hypothetical protein
MPETIHLHWLFAVPGCTGGVAGLRGVTLGTSICGKYNLPRNELTAFIDDATCERCLEIADQPPKPQRMPRERLLKKGTWL